MKVSIIPVDDDQDMNDCLGIAGGMTRKSRDGHDVEIMSLHTPKSPMQHGSIASMMDDGSPRFIKGSSGDSIQFNLPTPRDLKTPEHLWRVSIGQKSQTPNTMIRFLTPEICCTLSRNALNSLAKDVTIPFSYRLIRRNRFNEVMGDFKCKSRENFKRYDIMMNNKEILTQVFTHPRYIRHSRSSQFIGDGFHNDKYLRFIEKTSKLIAEGRLCLSEIRR